MTPEQFEELMRVVRAGFLMLAMIGYASLFNPSTQVVSESRKLLLVAMQAFALAIAPLAMMRVLQ